MFNLRSAVGDGTVRVTERITSEPNARGERRLIAHAGRVLSLSEAMRMGVPEDKLEAAGFGGKLALASMRGEPVDVDELAEETLPSPDGDTDGDDGDADGPAVEGRFPQHRGGNWWTLSDGSKVQGGREDAVKAEQALHAETEIPPDGDTEGEATGDGSGEALPPLAGDDDQADHPDAGAVSKPVARDAHRADGG